MRGDQSQLLCEKESFGKLFRETSKSVNWYKGLLKYIILRQHENYSYKFQMMC